MRHFALDQTPNASEILILILLCIPVMFFDADAIHQFDKTLQTLLSIFESLKTCHEQVCRKENRKLIDCFRIINYYYLILAFDK